MAISDEKLKIVINNYFKSECDVNTSIREAFEKGFRIGVKKGLMQIDADHKTEPRTDLCEHCHFKGYSDWCDTCRHAKTKSQTCNTCKYGEDRHRYAHICNECGVGINNYEPKDEPQTETQTKTQNSNLTFEKRTMRDCYNCKKYETEGECIECHYEPKDEPQTDVYEYRNGEWVKPDCPWK